eukprot:NODE_229_length_13800_cov_0.838114.p2 type:complete len:516 gc:universal NODE_229_length_13800_cov_0.838114:2700-4247(+)
MMQKNRSKSFTAPTLSTDSLNPMYSSSETIKANEFDMNMDHIKSLECLNFQGKKASGTAQDSANLRERMRSFKDTSIELQRSQSSISLNLNTAQSYIEQLEQENESLSSKVHSILNQQTEGDKNLSNNLSDLLTTNIAKIHTLQQQLKNTVQVCKKLDIEKNEEVKNLATQNKLANHLKLRVETTERDEKEFLQNKLRDQEESFNLKLKSSSLEERLKEAKYMLAASENQLQVTESQNEKLKQFHLEMSDLAQQFFTTNNRILDDLERLNECIPVSLPKLLIDPILNISLNISNGLSLVNFISEMTRALEMWYLELKLLKNTTIEKNDTINETYKQNRRFQSLNESLTHKYSELSGDFRLYVKSQQDGSHVSKKYEDALLTIVRPYQDQIEDLKSKHLEMKTLLSKNIVNLTKENLKLEQNITKILELEHSELLKMELKEKAFSERENSIFKKEEKYLENNNTINRGITRLNRKLTELHLESLEIKKLCDLGPQSSLSKRSDLLTKVQNLKSRNK